MRVAVRGAPGRDLGLAELSRNHDTEAPAVPAPPNT